MMYQISISLYKFINGQSFNLSTELVRVLDQMVCTRRQVNVALHQNNNSKIGMNITGNKFYHVNNMC